MFGFVVANPEKLSEEQRLRYKGIYCGLCEELGEGRGFRYRVALTYDLVFLAIVLSSVCGEEYVKSEGRCAVHPMKKRYFLRNKYTSYAADMNIALAYYKYLDDLRDDDSKKALLLSRLFEKENEKIERKYPVQCEVIKAQLKELSLIEKNDVLIPDIPALSFGKLLGSIFAVDDLPEKEKLYEFGVALGKFIYLLDAAVDLKHDIKKQSYNPFFQMSSDSAEPILRMLMAECVEKYNELPVKQDKEIIENILFSGIWTQYDVRKKGNKSEQKSI